MEMEAEVIVVLFMSTVYSRLGGIDRAIGPVSRLTGSGVLVEVLCKLFVHIDEVRVRDLQHLTDLTLSLQPSTDLIFVTALTFPTVPFVIDTVVGVEFGVQDLGELGGRVGHSLFVVKTIIHEKTP
tara:strand:+ start:282 stop:659 length:378 start_codon:yes stop_codon:yes gene_type:complete